MLILSIAGIAVIAERIKLTTEALRHGEMDVSMTAESKINAQLSSSSRAEFSFWRAFGRHWRASVRYYGLQHTITQIAGAAYRFFREFLPGRRKAKYGDLDYDFDHNVDTTRANVGFRAQLIAALSSHQYFPTEPWLFEQMMQALTTALSSQVSALSPERTINPPLHAFTFVDLGSGKGRCLLMAAPYGFKRIIGVEFMPEWDRIAQENIGKFASIAAAESRPAPPIETICMDARDFDFPLEPLVIYLFNPFPEPVLAAVLERLRESLQKQPRPMLLAYRFPEFEPLLRKCDWLEKIAGTEQWALWKNRASGSDGPISQSPDDLIR
jgi:SAM-dependent methyltransferase